MSASKKSSSASLTRAFSSTAFIDSIAANKFTDCFNLNSPQFLALASCEEFSALKNNLIAVDIQAALSFLTPDSYFEITIPTIGMTDFLSSSLKDSIWNQGPQSFASILAINGFGGGAHARPDFITVKDIIGNHYEILVDKQGRVETPKEGIGLFSILSEITLMFTSDQIISGRGLTSLQAQGAQPNYLYCLAPPNSNHPFTITIRASHLDEQNRHQVDFQQTCPIVFNPPARRSNPKAGLSKFAARTLIRNVFTELELMKSLLSNKMDSDFSIATQNQFNDFKLSPEALGAYYDLLLNAVIEQKIPSEFIFSRISDASIEKLDLSYAPLDSHDQDLIKNCRPTQINDLFQLSPRHLNYRSTLPPQEPEKNASQRLYRP